MAIICFMAALAAIAVLASTVDAVPYRHGPRDFFQRHHHTNNSPGYPLPSPSSTSSSASSTLVLGTSAAASTTPKLSMVSTNPSTTASSVASYSSNSTVSMPTSTGRLADRLANRTSSSGFRGVNIGGWLVLESWMNSDVFNGTDATDQYTFDSTSGAADTLQNHWDTYFTEDDVQQIAAWGINAMRIPIGYWAYNNTGTPYIQGADAYLEKAIGWARTYGLKVLVDCHGSPGSQNGFDNSGQSGNVDWQTGDNLAVSISVLETMAEKYGSSSYADVVYGIELVNEPISWDQNNFDVTRTWAQDAYTAVKSKATNPNLIVVMHDGFMGPYNWRQTATAVNGNGATKSSAQFAVDVHLYQNQVDADSSLNQNQHITKACAWTLTQLLPASAALPVYVGEFSAQTNICANPDNSTVAGSTCWQDTCQCSSNVPMQYWNPPLKTVTRQFFEAQVEAFEHSAQGWFLWSWKAPGSWGLQNLIQFGVLGSHVTDKLSKDYCGFGAEY